MRHFATFTPRCRRPTDTVSRCREDFNECESFALPTASGLFGSANDVEGACKEACNGWLKLESVVLIEDGPKLFDVERLLNVVAHKWKDTGTFTIEAIVGRRQHQHHAA